jgi:hypothetical protein
MKVINKLFSRMFAIGVALFLVTLMFNGNAFANNKTGLVVGLDLGYSIIGDRELKDENGDKYKFKTDKNSFLPKISVGYNYVLEGTKYAFALNGFYQYAGYEHKYGNSNTERVPVGPIGQDIYADRTTIQDYKLKTTFNTIGITPEYIFNMNEKVSFVAGIDLGINFVSSKIDASYTAFGGNYMPRSNSKTTKFKNTTAFYSAVNLAAYYQVMNNLHIGAKYSLGMVSGYDIKGTDSDRDDYKIKAKATTANNIAITAKYLLAR